MGSADGRVELDERGLDLAEHLADGDAEDALAAADEVDDLVVRRAEVDARAVAHERGLGQVVDARLAELVDRGADLLQRDAGVEKSLDELEHEDVAEAVEALRAGAGGAAHGRLDETGAGPVVELAVGDAGGTGGDGSAVAGSSSSSAMPSVKRSPIDRSGRSPSRLSSLMSACSSM